LVKTLHKAGLELEDLWPAGAVQANYEDFPAPTQGESGWGYRFQKWVDDLYLVKKIREPDA